MASNKDLLQRLLSGAGDLLSSGDVEAKIVIPFLKGLGYTEEDFQKQFSADVIVGSREARIEADFLVRVRIQGQSVMVIDAKHPHESITPKDVLQTRSYAVLIEAPHIAPLAITTNGLTWDVRNVITEEILSPDGIPIKSEAQDFLSAFLEDSTPPQQTDAKRVLLTIAHLDQLKSVFSECKEVLKLHEGLLPDEAFNEISKLLLSKLYEEKRILEGDSRYRFEPETLEAWGYLHGLQALFDEAIVACPLKLYHL